MLNKIMKLIFLVLFIITFLQSCDTTEPEKNGSLLLNLEEVSCTETWLSLKATSDYLPEVVNIFQENNIVAQLSIPNKQDTIIYIDSLQPSSSYNFVAQAGNLKSNIAVATTMDTTSHNFTWQTFTFGEIASSNLYDVAVIDENNIWAVGEIYMYDSLGNPDPACYNVVHWNGQSWDLKRIPILLNGTPFYPTIKSIFAFNQNDIWYEAGIHWDGFTFKQIPFNIQWNGNVNKMWGSSSNDLFIVGNGSPIAHYNGFWEKMEIGTTLPFQDIWGSKKIKENDSKILCVASDKYEGHGPEVYEIKNNLIVPQLLEGLPWSISSVWFKNELKTYIVGDGIYIQNAYSTNKTWKNANNNITTYYMHTIRGNDVNDIFMGGAGGEIVHFNGVTWKTYKNDGVPNFYGNYLSVTVKENLVCFVGNYVDNKVKAIITIGQR